MHSSLLASLVLLLLLACCGLSLEADNNQATGHRDHAGVKQVTDDDISALAGKRDDSAVREWLVGGPEVMTSAQIDDASMFLQSLTRQVPQRKLRSDGQFLFWKVNMTDGVRIQALGHPGISSIDLNLKLVDARVLPAGSPSPKERRNIEYTKQELAPRELAAISQPSGVPDVNQFKDYVYESHAGSKSFIYHVEYGVAFRRHANEFHKVAPSILTPEARSKGMKDDDDNSQSFHSTCTADKALGRKYGVAKQATLVPVILAEDDLAELTAGFEEVARDLQIHPVRQGFSVASLSLVTDGPGGRQAALLARAIEKVMRLDVPVVCPAGNFGGQPGREEIDTYPALFASRDFPLIVVGSSSPQGEKSEWSQVGYELTLYAVGEDITCLMQSDVPATGLEGTSFSTPIVAGQIANLLSYDQIPIDTSNGNLVRNMRDYLKENPAAGWTRSGDTRVLWNGVTEADNPRMKTCAGLGANKYVARETLRAAIQDDFCAAGPSVRLSRRYNAGSMEDVVVSLDFYQPNPDSSVLGRDACVRYLLAEVTDGCDGNDPEGNPGNYKGGGSATLGGAIYRVEPQTLRQPAKRATEDGHGYGCDSTFKFLWNSYVVWGHGWLSGDFGKAFRDELAENCGLDVSTWNFEYGLGDDGREWTAWFRTQPNRRSCVQWATKSVGAPEDLQCHGTG